MTWHTHGKTLARLKDSTKEQARKKADQFLSGLKIPMMEDLAIEQVRREVAAVMARQRRDRGRSAVTVEKPEPQKLKSLTFDPAVGYLVGTASQRILDEYLLGRMNQAANLRKAIAEMHGALVTLEAEGMLAQWLAHNREALLDTFRRAAGAPVLNLPNRAQTVVAEIAQRLLGPAQPKRKRLLGPSK